MSRRVLTAILSAAGLLTMDFSQARAGDGPPYARLPPPEVAYRDPAYLPPPPPPPRPIVRVPRSLNLPLYNEPPPRF